MESSDLTWTLCVSRAEKKDKVRKLRLILETKVSGQPQPALLTKELSGAE